MWAPWVERKAGVDVCTDGKEGTLQRGRRWPVDGD